jgi:sigma54-dependent transcription regulator
MSGLNTLINLVRRTNPVLLAEEIANVQPMNENLSELFTSKNVNDYKNQPFMIIHSFAHGYGYYDEKDKFIPLTEKEWSVMRKQKIYDVREIRHVLHN